MSNMGETKHTPGPWKAVEEYNGWAIEGPTPAGHMSDYIASEINKGRDMGEADAKLIAAAPELLEALRVIRDSFWSEGEPLQERIEYLKTLAADAIKKATDGKD